MQLFVDTQLEDALTSNERRPVEDRVHAGVIERMHNALQRPDAARFPWEASTATIAGPVGPQASPLAVWCAPLQLPKQHACSASLRVGKQRRCYGLAAHPGDPTLSFCEFLLEFASKSRSSALHFTGGGRAAGLGADPPPLPAPLELCSHLGGSKGLQP